MGVTKGDVKRIIFKCPEELFSRLVVEADKEGVTWTAFINSAIDQHITQMENLRNYPQAMDAFIDLVKRVEKLEKTSSAKPKSLS